MKTMITALVVLGLGIAMLAGCSGSRSTQPLVVARDNRVEVTVTAHGFEPSLVQVTHGQPVTMVVTRTTDMTCATEMVMPLHGIHMNLPLNQPMEVTFPCDWAGAMTYTCGMGMVKGSIIAR